MATKKKTSKKPTTSKKPAAGAAKKKSTRKKKVEPASRGLEPAELLGEPPAAAAAAAAAIERDGGQVLASYRDPLGGHWHLLAGLPVQRVEPTPFQRDLSTPHVNRLAHVVEKLGRFLDPIIAVRSPADDGTYWTPNGGHRLAAMKQLGARAVVCLVVPELEVAYKILALNTEKAHSLSEKCLEVIRMARALADSAQGGGRAEASYETEFEDPAFVTLGCCYLEDKRFAGSAYTSVLNRIEAFLDAPLAQALQERERRAAALRRLDEAVGEAVERLKRAGFVGSGLRGFVIKAINPLASAKRGARAEFAPTIEKMTAAAGSFDPDAVDTSELPRVE